MYVLTKLRKIEDNNPMKHKFDRRLSFISNCFLLEQKQRMPKQCRKELKHAKFRMRFKIFSRKFTVSRPGKRTSNPKVMLNSIFQVCYSIRQLPLDSTNKEAVQALCTISNVVFGSPDEKTNPSRINAFHPIASRDNTSLEK